MHIEYPKYLYHPKIAPTGRVFQNAEETKSLGRGWVDNPGKFPAPSKTSTWLKESFKPWWIEWEWLVKSIAIILSAIAACIVLVSKFLV